jgi:hypothetical protein
MNISLIGSIPLVIFGLSAIGCESSDVNTAEELIACPEIRPEVCTQEYDPVCALRKDGSYKTYSNGCSSCSDTEVVGYMADACE